MTSLMNSAGQRRNTERYVAELECQLIQNGRIQYQELQKYVKADPILQRVIYYVHNGWPSRLRDKQMQAFASCQQQLSVRDGCVLKHAETTRIVVPSAIRQQLLKQLHVPMLVQTK